MWLPAGIWFPFSIITFRFNVYNTVKVTLNNEEFGKISTKEVEVAKYLDLLHTVHIPKEGDDKQFTFDNVFALSDVDHSIETVRNK